MPDPTPEERAEALRLAEGWADRWTGQSPSLAVARALLAAESERAELQNAHRFCISFTSHDEMAAHLAERAELAREVEARRAAGSGLETALEQSLDREESLAREVERLTSERDAYSETLTRVGHEHKKQKDRAERAEREVEELRGALRRIANETRTDWLAARIARAALSEPTEGE